MLQDGGPPASWAPLLLHPRLPVEPGKGGDWQSLGVGPVQSAGVAAVSCRAGLAAPARRTQVGTGVNLSSGSRGSGGSSRRRRARRGPGGCRRTAAVPGPPSHDRSAASGSRAPLMPCRGSWRVKGLGSGRGRGFLSSDAGTNWVRRWAQITAAAPRVSLPPEMAVAPAFQKWLGVAGAPSAWCLLYCAPPASRRVSSSPSAPEPAQPFPLRLRSPLSWRSHTSLSQVSKPISHPVPLDGSSRFSLGD